MTPSTQWQNAVDYAATNTLSVEDAKTSRAYIEMLSRHIDNQVECVRNNLRNESIDDVLCTNLCKGAD